jgi:N-acetylglucosaminyldiphosphoundecaprenol N-acetyl-beta-D-mannosaminyltransferase
LGVGVSAINLAQVLGIIGGWIARRQQHYVCITGVHGIMESQWDEGLRRIHNNAGLVTPDGMPLVWLNRLHGYTHVERVYGPDLMLALCEHSDIVWVGLSTPKQERWMAEHVGRITAPVLIGVGAAFDFHSGLKKQAPRWMQRSGLEWLFRLATEPRRLWRRYLVNNPLFAVLVLQQALGLKRYPDD